MKYFKTILLISVMLSLSLITRGQEKVEVEPIHKEMRLGKQFGFKVNVPLESMKNTEKEWGKYITGGAKVKVIKNKYGIEATGAVVERITRSPMNIYSVLFEHRNGVQLEAWFSVDSIFIADDPNDSRAGAIRSFLYDFAIERYKDAQEDLIKLETKNLETMNSELVDLRDEKNKLENGISKSERGIESMKEDIAEINSDQERKSKEIEKQKDLVMEYKDHPEEHKIQKKELKGLQKELNKMEKNEEGMYSSIDRFKEQIRNAQHALTQNENLQSLKEKEIEEQKVKLKEMETLLLEIK